MSEEKANEFFTTYLKNFKGYKIPLYFQKISKDIEDLEVYDDDVWVCSFPKCGTTWTQEMVWCISNNLDFEAAKEQLDTRFAYLELSCFFDVDCVTDEPDILLKSVEVVKNMKRPRFIKSHLPWELMPKQILSFEKRPKIIYVVRNPMDTCVSLYYFVKLLGFYSGNVESFSQQFLKNNVMYSPYMDHVLSYWNRRSEPNMLFIKYEDMQTKLSWVVDLVAEFLGKTLTDDGKDNLISHLSFDTMKKEQTAVPITAIKCLQKINPHYDKEGQFLRSGKSGGYRSEMSEETIDHFKREFMDKLEKAGLQFAI